jgi:hypothetical protein
MEGAFWFYVEVSDRIKKRSMKRTSIIAKGKVPYTTRQRFSQGRRVISHASIPCLLDKI